MSNTSILTRKIFESILAEIREQTMDNGLSPLLLMKKKSGEQRGNAGSSVAEWCGRFV